MNLIDQLVSDYGDAYAEARICRQDCALFDFSFVCRARLSGNRAVAVLAQFQPRKVDDMRPGQIRFSVTLGAMGRVGSDLTLWRISADCFEVMSASRSDIDALLDLAQAGVKVEDRSENTAILAVQGPNALAALGASTDLNRLETLAYFNFVNTRIDEFDCVIGRLGYCGEKGFEILLDAAHAPVLWRRLSAHIMPAGFAAIDILRIEAGLFLYTHECRLEANYDEMGLTNVLRLATRRRSIKLIGFKAKTAIDTLMWQPRDATLVAPQPGEIRITSACFSPHLEQTIGLGFISVDHKHTRFVDPETQFQQIEVARIPFIDPGKTIPRAAWPLPPR